ncbi:MAG: rane protein HdeD [Methanolobus sp.]|nr:rane protein HdeD [Methanolobus sp.]
MSSSELLDFLDLVLRLCIFLIALMISSLLVRIDADVIRSRIYVSFRKLKGAFVLLTVGFLFYLAETFIDLSGPVASASGNDLLTGALSIAFQALVLFFLYHLYVAIRVPDRRIL